MYFNPVDLGYSPELSRVLQTFQLPNSQADEQELCLQFDQPDQNRKWREGVIKSSFNYLLLDPRSVIFFQGLFLSSILLSVFIYF